MSRLEEKKILNKTPYIGIPLKLKHFVARKGDCKGERSHSSREPSHGTHPNANGKIILKSTFKRRYLSLPVPSVLFRQKKLLRVMETTFTLIFHTNRLCRRHHIIIIIFFVVIIIIFFFFILIIVLPISRSWESWTQHVFFGDFPGKQKNYSTQKSTRNELFLFSPLFASCWILLPQNTPKERTFDAGYISSTV